MIDVKIDLAKQLLAKVRHCAIATVNEDGSPHNTPVFFLPDEKLEHIYWASHPESMHSQNIARTGQVFIVIYEAVERGGLYFKCENAHELSGDDLVEGLRVHNARRAKEGKGPLTMDYYQPPSTQRMYGTTVTSITIPVSERDINGLVVKDYRHEIRASDLIN